MADPVTTPRFYFQLRLEAESADAEAVFQEAAGLPLEQPGQEQLGPEQPGPEPAGLGGQNQHGHRQPPLTRYGTPLVLRRGLMSTDSAVAIWVRALNGSLASPIVPRNVLLTLVDATGAPLAGWLFTQTWPVKWSLSEVELSETVLAVDTLDLAYSNCQRL